MGDDSVKAINQSRLACHVDLPIVEQLKFKMCVIEPGQGVTLSLPHQDHDQSHVQLHKSIKFGQSLLSVLQSFGNPNKEYYRGKALFLNYLELGIDVMFESGDFTVKKLIIHLSNSKLPNFCFYDKLQCILSVSKELKQEQIE